jgi:hypothetical protein
LFLEVSLFELSVLSFELVELLLQLFIRISVLVLLNQFHAFPFVLLFQIGLEFFELLVLCDQRVSQHVDL